MKIQYCQHIYLLLNFANKLDIPKFKKNWIVFARTFSLAVLGIFLIQLFPNWTACSPITYTNRCRSLPGADVRWRRTSLYTFLLFLVFFSERNKS